MQSIFMPVIFRQIQRQKAFILFLLCLGMGWPAAWGAGLKTLYHHVPDVIRNLPVQGDLPGSNRLDLAMGVALRDPVGLSNFLSQVYDPASPNYHHFLTPAEFTAQFGPTAADYEAVKDFARTNGLKVTQTYGTRLLLDVQGSVANINRAFHLTLHVYHHPTEKRDFFAPDREPTVDARIPLVDVSGLSNYQRPKPQLVPSLKPRAMTSPRGASGPQGSYWGNDFRQAYVPGTTLDGTGQMVGLLEFDGYYDYDVNYYAEASGIRSVPVEPVLLDGVNGVPGFSGSSYGNSEVSLDIEMAMAMAPGLSAILVFEGNIPNDVLGSMAASNQVTQLSSSWGWTGGPSTSTDNILQEMAAQGQSFFDASGDNLAYTLGNSSTNGVDNPNLQNAPASSPYLTSVGATTLTTSANGSFAGETVWNNGSAGTGGGTSSYYGIPSWQAGVSMASNGGSSSFRNIPDVAIVGDNIWVYYQDGEASGFSGTSCAAPLWAGFAALVNQKASSLGMPPLGFINPALYKLAEASYGTPAFANFFNDVTNGNNEWSQSPNEYSAVPGFDLCSGWGSPAGTNLINALLGLDDHMEVIPGGPVTLSGAVGGPFPINYFTETISNAGPTTFNWRITGIPAWLTASAQAGTLVSSGRANVIFNLNSTTSNLLAGTYSAPLWFSNATSHVTQSRMVTLQVLPALQAVLSGPFSQSNSFSATGPYGGPFVPSSIFLTLSNIGASSLNWSLVNTSQWLSVSSLAGALSPGGDSTVNLSVAASAKTLAPGVYAGNLVVKDVNNAFSMPIPVSISVGQNLVANGGFETGDFTDWYLVGDPIYPNSSTGTYNGVLLASSYPGFAHSGQYGAALGESGFLATITQNIATSPGQLYLLSAWIMDTTNLPTAQFELNWDGATVYNLVNPPSFNWNLIQVLVTASQASTPLQVAAENDNGYWGLDDVALIPVPDAGFESVTPQGRSLKLTWASSPGLLYQVQSTTNLANPVWSNLGVLTTATSNTLTISDVNALQNQSQTYYRLVVNHQ